MLVVRRRGWRGDGGWRLRRHQGGTRNGGVTLIQTNDPHSGSSLRHTHIIRVSLNVSSHEMAAILHQEIIWGCNTDCVEFCPAPEHPDWLALGSYELNEKTGDRLGGLDLFRVHRGGENAAEAPRLTIAASASGLPGVFDAHWQLINGAWTLSVALSDGSLRLYRPPPLAETAGGDGSAAAATGDGEASATTPSADAAATAATAAAAAAPSAAPMQLEEIDNCRAATQMALCVDWAAVGGGGGGGSSGGGSGQQHVAAVSSSGGSVTLLQVTESGLRRLSEWHAHELEAWCVAFDKHQVCAAC